MCVRCATLGILQAGYPGSIIGTHSYKMRQETRWTGSGKRLLLNEFKAKERNDDDKTGNILGSLKAGAINDNG